MPTEVKIEEKSFYQLVKEYFVWTKKAWPVIWFVIFVHFHSVMIKLFPDPEEHLINVWFSVSYQIIGAGYVIVQLDQSLKILKNISIIEDIKHHWGNRPKRIKTTTIVNIKAGIMSVSSTMTAKFSILKADESLEEKIERLSKKIDGQEKKMNEMRSSFNDRLTKDKKQTNDRLNSLDGKVTSIENNLTDTVIGDYKKAIFGVLLIMYGICVPLFELIIK